MKRMRYLLLLLLTMYCSITHAQNASITTLTLHFNNKAGDTEIALNTGKYINAAGDTFTVSLLQYFISNIQLVKEDGSVYTIPQDSSYFFIQQDDSATHSCTLHVPVASYKAIRFLIGIDSIRNTAGIDKRTGILDPTLTDMYWGWNSGYIFLKMEGFSSSAPEDAAGLHKYRFHIGGFGGYKSRTINNIKTVQLDFPNKIKFSTDQTFAINIKADVLKLFNAKTPVNIAKHSAVMFDEFSTVIANNYASMFSLEDIQQP
jgi:hypothetical protein